MPADVVCCRRGQTHKTRARGGPARNATEWGFFFFLIKTPPPPHAPRTLGTITLTPGAFGVAAISDVLDAFHRNAGLPGESLMTHARPYSFRTNGLAAVWINYGAEERFRRRAIPPIAWTAENNENPSTNVRRPEANETVDARSFGGDYCAVHHQSFFLLPRAAKSWPATREVRDAF